VESLDSMLIVGGAFYVLLVYSITASTHMLAPYCWNQ